MVDAKSIQDQLNKMITTEANLSSQLSQVRKIRSNLEFLLNALNNEDVVDPLTLEPLTEERKDEIATSLVSKAGTVPEVSSLTFAKIA